MNKVDVVWPSSEIPVDQIKSKYGSKIRKSVSVGYSPMIVATWAPIKDLLQQNGLIKQENGINFIDIQKLIKLTIDNKKWNELNGSDKYYNSRKTVLIKTTDPNKSNSGLLYMALSSYIMNDFKVINDTTVSAVLQKIRPLFDLQGYKSSTSAIPWNDFLNKGRGDTPLVWIYEAQFINYVYQNGYKVGDTEIVQLYLEPTIWSNHVLMSLSDKGDKFVDALTTDEDLQKIFNEYGFRNNYKNGQYFYKYFIDKKVTIPENLNQVAAPSQFSAMKSLLSYFK